MNTASGPRDTTRGRTGEFVQLLTGNQSRLYAYICSLLCESSGARDVLQETNLALWNKAQEYDPARPFLPWAYRVAYLQVLAYRKRCARSRLVFDERVVGELAEEASRRDVDLDRRLEALGDCMGKLPGPRRELLDRRYLHGESVDQIAGRLHKPPNVVAASLYRIRKALLECIESKITGHVREATGMSEGGDEIESLIDAVIDGRCDESGLRRFEGMVRDDPRARKAYLDQMGVHALLEWRHGRVEAQVPRARADGPRWWGVGRRRWGLAALILIGIGLVVLAPRLGRGRAGIATLVEARNVVWARGQAPIAVHTRLDPQEIRCLSGMLRLAFDSGAQVSLEGPANLRILSGMRMRAVQGRFTARGAVGTNGFAIETPNTLVVDQGTEFGVEVDASGQTGVVVFEGLVDLSRTKPAEGPAPVTRLGQGEALRVGPAGLLSRIVAVERRHGDDEWMTGPSSDRDGVIRSVRDNIRGLESSKYYQIVRGGLDEDVPAYVDRPHQWNGLDASGLPPFLIGADYIMPFNEDKWRHDLMITVEVARPATLFVFCDNREKPPSWLAGQFTDTGIDIGLDEGSWPDPSKFTVDRGPGLSINQVFSVWKRDVDRDESIELGALEGGKNNRAMYGIAAVARP